MALIKCDECGADVSDKAVACPKCGNPIHVRGSIPPMPISSASVSAPTIPTNSNASTRRKLGGGLAAFLIAVIAFMVYESQPTGTSSAPMADASNVATVSPPPSGTAEPQPSEQATEATTAIPVIEISATQLYEEYKANEVLADTKYKGRWLYDSGVVNEIGKDITDDPYVNLFGENEYAVESANFA